MMFYVFSNYMNGLCVPKFKMSNLNINCNKIKIHIGIRIKKFQFDWGD